MGGGLKWPTRRIPAREASRAWGGLRPSMRGLGLLLLLASHDGYMWSVLGARASFLLACFPARVRACCESRAGR